MNATATVALPRSKKAKENGKGKDPKPDVGRISESLQNLQKQRVWYLKSRNMIQNRLRATVAGANGYCSGMEESERRKSFKEADQIIKDVVEGRKHCPQEEMIKLTWHGAVIPFDAKVDDMEKAMVKLAKQLPVAKWVEQPNQKGFGLLFLAIVIGETGDLCNYENPGKVWRRMGAAPFTNGEGVTLMGATWRGGKEGKLHKEEWEEYGYCPRRRSITYLIGEGIVKANGVGPYRTRYDDAKGNALKRKDWTTCSKCNGKGKNKTGKGSCPNCKGTGKVKMRCHLHAMLLASKLLLKNLWLEWNDHPEYTPNW